MNEWIKENMLIFKFIILFWVTTRISLHALSLKKHFSFVILSSFSSAILSPALLNRPVSSDWSVYTRLSQHRQHQQQRRCAKSMPTCHTRCTLWKCMTRWHSVMSQRHVFRGGATDDAFLEQRSLWERGGCSMWSRGYCLLFPLTDISLGSSWKNNILLLLFYFLHIYVRQK